MANQLSNLLALNYNPSKTLLPVMKFLLYHNKELVSLVSDKLIMSNKWL